MLWMKAWLETRWRLLYTLAIPLAAVALPHIIGNGVTSQKAADKAAHTFMGVMAFFSLFGAAYLAGAGISVCRHERTRGIDVLHTRPAC